VDIVHSSGDGFSPDTMEQLGAQFILTDTGYLALICGTEKERGTDRHKVL